MVLAGFSTKKLWPRQTSSAKSSIHLHKRGALV